MRNPFEKDMQQHPIAAFAGKIVGNLVFAVIGGMLTGVGFAIAIKVLDVWF